MLLVDKDAFHDDWLTRGAEEDEPMSEAERAAAWDEDAWTKQDNDALDRRDRGVK